MDYFELKEKLINEKKASVKDLPMYRDRDRRGHQAFMYIDKKDFKNVNNLGKELKKIRGKFHVSSFDGLELEEELLTKLKENFEDAYLKAVGELEDPTNETTNPTVVAAYISELSERKQTKALSIINDWFGSLEN